MSKRQKEEQRKRWLQALPTAAALAFLFAILLPVLRDRSDEPVVELDASDSVYETRLARHPLSGVWLDEKMELPAVFGAMIDNHVDARPQAGIDKAFLVIEVPVEAGIPRILALFDANAEVERIGPIRSARPYFIDWNNEFDALYAHVGGSDDALEKIARNGTFDVNEYAHAGTYWRAPNRYAPHNTYTSSDRLGAFLDAADARDRAPELLYGVWTFKDPVDPAELSDASSYVSIEYWPPLYTVQWIFDARSNKYDRFQNGQSDITDEQVSVKADNVVVLVTDVKIIDSVGRRDVRTLGRGSAWVMQDGRVFDAIWEKPTVSERLRFYTTDGKEIAMNFGSTWIEVVASKEDIKFER
jgi:hypothetical protein